jgi:serine phosphatase RsbU (regulator of sigma subunit)
MIVKILEIIALFILREKTARSKRHALLFLVYSFFCYYAHATYAQQLNSDSLLAVARTAKTQKDLPTALRNYLQVMKAYESQQQNKPEIAKTKLAPLYIEIGQIYEEGNLPDKALDYFRKSNQIDERANTNELVGNELLKSQKYEDALAAYQKALLTYQKENNYKNIIRNLQQVVTCYKRLNQYDKALDKNNEILGLVRNAKDKQEELTTLNNIGYTYRYLKNYTKALDFLNQALTLQRQLKSNTTDEIVALVNLGVVNQNIGNYSESLDKLSQALQIAQKQNNNEEICKIQDLIANVYLNSKDVYNAENYNELAVGLAEKLRQPALLEITYKTKSDILQAKEDFQNALTYYRKYLDIRDSLALKENLRQLELLQQQFMLEKNEKNTIDEIADEDRRLAGIKELKADLDRRKLQAEKEREKRQAEERITSERLKNQQLATEIAQGELKIAQQQREAERKDREIAESERKRIEQELQIEKDRASQKEQARQIKALEDEKKIQDLEQKQQAEENKFLYAVLLFIFVSTIIAFFSLANARKKNKLLAEQKNEIEVKNVELEQTQEELKAQRDTLSQKSEELNHAYTNIKASITYAKRIQEAILPPISMIQQYLPDSFVFYKPRDIVSGDFYWFAPISQQHLVITAVDCTGHGVPGAFMSMIGDSLLNQIIMEKGVISPDLILQELDKGVKNALRKGESDAKDGMDMSLCIIDKYAKTIEFAGAMNPICVVQNGELTEIKADKRPIGGDITNDYAFTKHIIDISKPTMLYLYSDGFQDQFGGAQGRKFMTKRFRELLFEIHQKSMAEQKKILEETIEDWKGEKHKQIDDILVIGVALG